MELGLEAGNKEKVTSRKRAKTDPPADSLLQPVKLSRAELYKEPTNEELNRLRETETLFHSSLLRLQVLTGDPGIGERDFPGVLRLTGSPFPLSYRWRSY